MQRVFTLGVCAMDNKVESSPMQAILKLLRDTGDFKIIIFTEDVILNEPIEKWPIVECLIAFYSYKFPLEKAIEYIEIHKPIVLNDLEKQRIFRSRINVYRELQRYRIPHPNYIMVDHDAVRAGKHTFEEHYDYIVYNNVRINKPFIEKPVDTDNHNNWIYYPSNAGGGCKKLFRKTHDRSSRYCADVHKVRTNGTYIYEEFMSTFGTDIKVYTVSCMFAHAEARKSPALDGKVNRYSDGKEVRFPVILTAKEKTIAYRIVDHFGQTVCGFDILRTVDGPYVCDVNGWSFVKRNKKYYMDCSQIIRIMFLLKLEAKYNIILRNVIPARFVADETAEALRKTFADVAHRHHCTDTDEELCSVIVVMRHGDRKPKHKLKFTSTHPKIMSYFQNCPHEKYIKLKSSEDLKQMSEVNSSIISELEARIKELTESTSSSIENEMGTKSKIEEITTELNNHKELNKVLSLRDGFSGINRKVQLKGIQSEGTDTVDHVLIIAKWGGELTSVGKIQAEDLGRRLRQTLYPTDSSGLIRLHSTYRHDFKIFSSDEGRCQITSAAFTRGILDLDGELTPILVAMTVRNNKAHMLLDDNYEVMERVKCKKRLNNILKFWNDKEKLDKILSEIENNGGQYYRKALEQINFQMHDLEKLHSFIREFLKAIQNEIKMWMNLYSVDEYASSVVDTLYEIQFRWKRLLHSFKDSNDSSFDFTKLANIVDNARYDLIHHHFLLGSGLDTVFEMYNIVQRLSSAISPCEYGVTPHEKLTIGVKFSWKLLQKILHDLTTHLSYIDSSNQSTDTYRNRDLLYATLVAPDKITKTKVISRGRLLSMFSGFIRSSNYKGLTELNKFKDCDGESENTGANYESIGAISAVAAASASAASVAATCLAVSNASINDTGAYIEDNRCFIGGVCPTEMFLCSYETHIEKLWKRLESNELGKDTPVVINSSTLWAHQNLRATCSKEDLTDIQPSADDGDLVRLEANEARKLSIRSPYRMVRSRYYVTSASHLFSIFNFFKYAHHLDPNSVDENSRSIDDIKDLHYLSHIVLRVWRSKDDLGNDKNRLEVLVSSGAKDGFGQNYELLAKNAKSQKHKYRRHIQRFKSNSSHGKLLCKRCHTSIDYSCVRDHTSYVRRKRSFEIDTRLKRSLSVTPVFKNCNKDISEFMDDVSDFQFLGAKTHKNIGSKGFLCNGCFVEEVFCEKDESKEVLTLNNHINNTPDSFASIENKITNSVDPVNTYDFGSNSLMSNMRTNDTNMNYAATHGNNIGDSTENTPNSGIDQNSVPPYCELGKLVVLNRNFELSKFKQYVNQAIDTFLCNPS